MSYKFRYLALRERNDGTEEEPNIVTYKQPMVRTCPNDSFDNVNEQIRANPLNSEITVEEIEDDPIVPTQSDLFEAQLTYTAMMTGTLLEV
jgi:hypothetical protein